MSQQSNVSISDQPRQGVAPEAARLSEELAFVRMKRFNKWRLRFGWVLTAAIFGLAPAPSLAWLIAGCLLVSVGVVVRILAAGTLTKIDTLTTHGVYAATRNPLYLGSLLVGLGFGCLGGHWLWPLSGLLFFSLIYREIILAEERFLSCRYGENFHTYCQQTPRLLPNPGKFLREGLREFAWDRVYQNNEMRNIRATGAFLACMALKVWWLPAGTWWTTARIVP